tara:strand:+ start:836 stop:1747 length:912 start_codon:yes stop_codon:yes gene_type:complete
MAEAKEQMDIEFKGMPGADVLTKDEAESFQVDLNFEGTEVEAEVEAKVEVETEAEAEPEVEVEPEKPKAPMVPKSRLDEVLAKNKKLQKQIEDTAQQEAERQAEAPKYDFDVKEQEYQQLVLDGEAKKATSLRKEIRNAEKEQVLFEVKQETGKDIAQDRAVQELQAKAAEIAEVFPILDENSSGFDKDLAQEVIELRDAFMHQGYEPADSLAKATDVTLTMKHPELLQVEGSTSNLAKTVIEKRQKTTVKKKLEASRTQPPPLKGEGTSERGDKAVDLNVLSDDEFSALPEETLRRMRGDFG